MVSHGLIHLKTDNLRLFDFTMRPIRAAGLEVIKRTDDLHADGLSRHPALITTSYERRYLAEGKTIRYCCFRCDS
jgi:tRNA G46 methylase TrmB